MQNEDEKDIAKDIKNKPRLGLVSPYLIEAVGKVRTYGSMEKYRDTETSHAIIALDQETLTALKRWQYVQATKYRLSSLIFPARHSNQCHSISYPNKELKKLCHKAKIPSISVHCLRHTHCTLLIRSGINIKDVQARMRHSDIETTLKIYTHQTKDTQTVVNTFSEFVANS